MTQYNEAKISEQEINYGNEGAYSFFPEPRSIKKFDFYFGVNKSKSADQTEFNEIRIRYYDEKDEAHLFPFKTVERCWVLGELRRDGKWELLKE